MRVLKTTIAMLMATSIACHAHAQDSGAYGELGVTAYNTDLYGAEVKLGYNFNKYFGVEAQGSVGLTTDSDLLFDSPTAPSVRTTVDYSVGAFAVARLPLNEKFDVFARGGIHNTQASAEIDNLLMSELSETVTGVAVGAGAQFNFNKKSGIRAEYTYFDRVDGGAISLGYIRKF